MKDAPRRPEQKGAATLPGGPSSRREFLKKAALVGMAGGGLPSIGQLLTKWSQAMAGDVDPDDPPRRWVMVIDLARCDGCGDCTTACSEEHFVPPGQEWMQVFNKTSTNGGGEYAFPRPCMNCQKAPCVKVCPVGASYYNKDNIVLINHDTCIGCRFCMAACPYDARFFNWEQPPVTEEELEIGYTPEFPVPHRVGTVEKCMFCAHRVEMEKLPACVEACTRSGMGAIYFGDANEDVVTNGIEVVRLSQLLARGQAYRYKEELGTEPSVYYLPPRGAS